MKKAKYIRHGHILTEVDGKKVDYKSINEAKRMSRIIQMKADGALGRGTVIKG